MNSQEKAKQQAVLEPITRLEAAEKDAARYRFLLDNPNFQIEYTGELSLDQHIDAAMKESEK